MRTPHSQSYAQAETAYCSNLHADTTLISLPLGNAPVVSSAQFSRTCAVRQAAAHAAVRPPPPPPPPPREPPPHPRAPGLVAPSDPLPGEPVRLPPKPRDHSRCYSRNN